MIGTVSL